MTDTDMSDLLPCPFCGGGAYDDWETIRTFGKRTGHEWAVACRWCEASSPGDDDLGLAIAAWNTRAPAQAQIDAAVRDERERCAKVAEACLDSHWGPWVAKVIRKGDKS